MIDLWHPHVRGQAQALAPIDWYEGLQLLPQHFQIWDARLEGLFRRQMLAANPYSWGIDHLRIDEAALMAGTLRVQSVAGQFPDGCVFAWSAAHGARLECSIEVGEEESSSTYALAIPIEDFSHNSARIQRFVQVVGMPVADLNNPDEKAVVARKYPNLRLQRWQPGDAHFVQIPIVGVARTAGGFRQRNFHPPAVRLLRDSACRAAVSDLVQRLRSVAASLEVAPLSGLLATDHRNGLSPVFHALVGGLPRLEALLSGDAAHPYEILLSLCDIAGGVASFTGALPERFPVYRHEDPASAIAVVVQYIARVVGSIGVDRRIWSATPFQLEHGRWICSAPDGETDPTEVLLRVVFKPTLSDDAISAWLDHTLICWATDERRLRETRVRGMTRSQHVAWGDLGAVAAQRLVRVQARAWPDADDRQLVVADVTHERIGEGVLSIEWMINVRRAAA